MGDRGLSGQWFPVHLKPQPDELLSSWLMRLSLAHGMEWRAFRTHLWPTLRVWGKEIDWRTDNDVLVLVAQKTAVALAQASATSMKDYAGRLFESGKPHRYPPWLPLNSRQDYRRRLPALQFCPRCLDTDAQPYFRRRWRLGFVTICTTHQRCLHDRCPRCRASVNFHCLPPDSPTLAVCYQCRFDLRLAPTQVLKDDPLPQCLSGFQTILLNALATAEHRLPVHGVVPSVDYFRVLHQLARVLITYRQAEYYRARLCRHFGIADFRPCFLSSTRRAVEVLSVNDRFQLMQLLAGWLDKWPDQFIAVCMDSMVWGRDLLERMSSPPAWYEQTAQQITWPNVLNKIFQQWDRNSPIGIP